MRPRCRQRRLACSSTSSARLTGRAWRDRLDERGNGARARDRAARTRVPELLARVLAGRGVEPDDVEAFLDPTVRRLMPDPHTVTAMEAAAVRIADAIERGESIAIFGDYDVDGATASALLARFLRHCGAEPLIHIPDRIFEGYGPNIEAIRALAEKRRDAAGHRRLRHRPASSRSPRRASSASTSSSSTIIRPTRRCRTRCVVNPNRLDDLSGLGHLAAVGLVFMTIVAVNRVLRRRGFWTDARPEPDLLGVARSRGARHRRRRGAAQGPQPRLRLQGTDRAAPARAMSA